MSDMGRAEQIEAGATEEHEDHHWCPTLDRRAALRIFGLSAMAAMSGCGVSSKTAETSSSTTSGTVATTTVLSVTPTTALTGASVTLTATVSPSAATGTVTFYDGSTAVGTGSLSGGMATLATSFSTAGTQSLTAAFGGSTTYTASTSAAVTLTVTGSTAAACTEALEGEEGPYFVDDSASGYLRSTILSNLDGSETQTGIPLELTIYVYDGKNSCAAMQAVQVDIWHCNAAGVYSAESSEDTVGQSWLRGYQLTDAEGKVTFSTIVPGWYQGRTTHIHLRLRSVYDSTTDSGTNTMQVFFDQTLVDTVDTTIAPYASEGKNSTTNAGDRVYTQQEKGTTLLSMTGSIAAGFAATLSVTLPITS